MRFSAISIAYGRFMLACWLTFAYYNIIPNIINKKMTKKQIFWAIPAKAISGGFAPDILPILTATTTDFTDYTDF